MTDLDIEDTSDQEISEKHSKLIEAIRELDKGQRVKKSERNEPSLTISEFHLVKSGVTNNDAIQVSDLVKSLGRKGHHAEITKLFNAERKKCKVLPKPLEKSVAERIKRTVGFEYTTKELQKWNAVVAQNRTAESVSFPLNEASLRLEPTDDFVKRFRIQSDLERELSALEPMKENVIEEDELQLSLEEILQRRAETAKFRAQQSYKVAKAHRQNNIKSKKFHRIQRKNKVKQQLKEFEVLQKRDLNAALKKLKHLEKVRAEERMTLRHKSTGQWARNKLIRAKYDKESRQELANQLSISRDLTQKIQNTDDTDEGSEDETSVSVLDTFKENPWINKAKTESEIDQFISQCRKYAENQSIMKKLNERQDIVEVFKKKKSGNKSRENTLVKVIKSRKGQKEEEEIYSDEHKDGVQNVSSSDNENNTADKEKKLQVLRIKSKSRKLVKSTQDENSKKENIVGTSSWTMTNFDNSKHKINNKVKNQIKDVRRKRNLNSCDPQNANDNESEFEDEYFDKLQWKGASQKSTGYQPLEENIHKRDAQNKNVEIRKTINGNIQGTEISLRRDPKEVKIDPNAFKEVKTKKLKTQLPDADIIECEAFDDADKKADEYEIINEAFSDDDVVKDFKREKEEEVKKTEQEDVNLKLPGWGSWSGKNINESLRKKRQFILKFFKDTPRKDENKGNVIIIEENNPDLKKHQVTELPFPFISVKDYEGSMRAPVGRNFVPEKTHRRLIKPAVRTKMGKIIEPMDEDSLTSTTNLKKKR